jgi:hypothetical protein
MLFDSSPPTPTSLAYSQNAQNDYVLPPAHDLIEAKSRINKLGVDLQAFIEEKLFNTYNLIGIYDQAEVEQLRSEVKQLLNKCNMLLKEKRYKGIYQLTMKRSLVSPCTTMLNLTWPIKLKLFKLKSTSVVTKLIT